MSETECTSNPVTEVIRTEVRGQRKPKVSLQTLSESLPTTTEESSPPEKNGNYLFEPGKSGNPAGRPKGAKNKITLLKQSLEIQLRGLAAPRMAEVLNKAIDLAIAGDRLMLKVLLELHMSKSQHEDSLDGDKSKVTLVVQNLTGSPRELKANPPIEGEVIKEIKENE